MGPERLMETPTRDGKVISKSILNGSHWIWERSLIFWPSKFTGKRRVPLIMKFKSATPTKAFAIQDSPNCRGRHYEEWVDLTGFKGRYIRIYGTSRFLSCCGYSIFETTVYVPDEEIV